ncbi:MAG: hypothetical protein IPQ24_18880 [Anaeromyxobacter sp.]|nr:hypothetical protein [Anaeromyxobacter sp.]
MTKILLAAAAAFSLLSACATTPTRAERMMAMCPMGVADTQVSAVDEVNGSTMTFTTRTQVLELQRRVHAMAAMHAERQAVDGSHGDRSGLTMEHGMDDLRAPFTSVTVFDLDNGASLKVTPTNQADLLRVQTAVRAHAERMQNHHCGMMGAKHGV